MGHCTKELHIRSSEYLINVRSTGYMLVDPAEAEE